MVYDDSAPLPKIAKLSHHILGDRLLLDLDVEGGSSEIMYQIDRSEIDPACQCFAQWLRYYESSPSKQRLGLKRNIKLRTDMAYAYRLRVVDNLGRKSAWSKVITSLATSK